MARWLGESPAPIWSLPGSELLRRGLRRAGIADVAAFGGAPQAGPVLLLRADHAYGAALLKGLAGAQGTLLCGPEDGVPVAAHLPADMPADAIAAALASGRPAADPAFAGLRAVPPGALDDGYNRSLRKRGVPLLRRITPQTWRAVEWETFGGSYKGVTDVITKHVWPVPAFHVTRACAALGITPNQVTLTSLVLVFVALWLFWGGAFWPGLLAAWAMTFLDTVDGKLARVTLTATPFGNIFDHAIDLIHPPFWWLAWIAGCAAAGLPVPAPAVVGAVIVGGYVLQRLQEGLFIARHGMAIHIWRRFDSAFRQVIARRNPNLVLLTLAMLAGRPDLGILAVAAWTAFGCLEQGAVAVQAELARRRAGRPLRSWLEA